MSFELKPFALHQRVTATLLRQLPAHSSLLLDLGHGYTAVLAEQDLVGGPIEQRTSSTDDRMEIVVTVTGIRPSSSESREWDIWVTERQLPDREVMRAMSEMIEFRAVIRSVADDHVMVGLNEVNSEQLGRINKEEIPDFENVRVGDCLECFIAMTGCDSSGRTAGIHCLLTDTA